MLRAICNQLVFPLRQRGWAYRRRPYSESLAEAFSQDYFRPELAALLSEESLRANCFYFSILEQFRGRIDAAERVLDVGSMSFFYAPALAQFAVSISASAKLTGLEADPARLYQDFFRRKDYALYYVSLANRFELAKTNYVAGDYLRWRVNSSYDLITCFFPFLFEDLSDRWGLPRRFFSPEKMFYKLSQEARQILFFHQGEEELTESLRLIKNIGGNFEYKGSFFGEPWLRRKNPVFGVLWQPSL